MYIRRGLEFCRELTRRNPIYALYGRGNGYTSNVEVPYVSDVMYDEAFTYLFE